MWESVIVNHAVNFTESKYMRGWMSARLIEICIRTRSRCQRLIGVDARSWHDASRKTKIFALSFTPPVTLWRLLVVVYNLRHVNLRQYKFKEWWNLFANKRLHRVMWNNVLSIIVLFYGYSYSIFGYWIAALKMKFRWIEILYVASKSNCSNDWSNLFNFISVF